MTKFHRPNSIGSLFQVFPTSNPCVEPCYGIGADSLVCGLFPSARGIPQDWSYFTMTPNQREVG